MMGQLKGEAPRSPWLYRQTPSVSRQLPPFMGKTPISLTRFTVCEPTTPGADTANCCEPLIPRVPRGMRTDSDWPRGCTLVLLHP